MCTFCGGVYVCPFSACMCTQLLFSFIFLCVFAGLFVYSCGCVVVVEDLHTGSQRQWFGHTEEISTLAVTHDAQVPHRHDQLVMLYWWLLANIRSLRVKLLSNLLGRRLHLHQGADLHTAASFACGTFQPVPVETASPITRGQCRALRFPGMTCTSSQWVSV